MQIKTAEYDPLFQFSVFFSNRFSGMRQIEEDLISKAKEASEKAYAPFSNFPVGAAILDDKGQIFSGCNVENSSYGLTICAERNAVFQAVAQQGPELKVIKAAIYTPTEAITPPCGACLQVLSEFAHNLEIVISNQNGETKKFKLDELMPFRFKL